MNVRRRSVTNRLAEGLEAERRSHGITRLSLDAYKHLADQYARIAEVNRDTVARQQRHIRVLEHQTQRCLRMLRRVRDARR